MTNQTNTPTGRKLFARLTALIPALLLAAPLAAGPMYTIQDLGTLPTGFHSGAAGISNSGLVTGWAQTQTTTGFEQHAFLWDGTLMKDLGTLGGSYSFGNGVNNSGFVAGTTQLSSLLQHAFLWNGTSMVDLGSLAGFNSDGAAINNAGWITGSSATLAGNRAFIWNGTSMTSIGTLGGSNSYGYDINDSGWVTGNSSSANTSDHAFIWNGTSMLDLGTLGGRASYGNSISNTGWVTGYYLTTNFDQRAFLWNGVSMLDLGTLSGLSGNTVGAGINDAGQVVGSSGNSAFVYTGGTMYNLNAILANGVGWTLTSASGINDAGQIVGTGTINGLQRAYLLTPLPDNSAVPEPSTWLGCTLGLAGLAWRMRRRA